MTRDTPTWSAGVTSGSTVPMPTIRQKETTTCGRQSVLIILGLAVTIAAALVYGSNRWQSATNEMHATLEAARLPDRANDL